MKGSPRMVLSSTNETALPRDIEICSGDPPVKSDHTIFNGSEFWILKLIKPYFYDVSFNTETCRSVFSGWVIL